MGKPQEKKIHSFIEFVEEVETLRSKTKGPIWYRGIKKSRYNLKPTLYRHPKAKSLEEFLQLEKRMLARFHQRSIPYHSQTLSDEWDTLFLMQHYGIPTRLLDWTESPFTALFFAIMFSKYRMGATRPIFESDAAIWVLFPKIWNQHSLKDISYKGDVLQPKVDNELIPYSPPIESVSSLKPLPVAMVGVHNSQRIVAQRGVFTVFGTKTMAMEHIYESNSYPSGSLQKIVIPKGAIFDIRKAIFEHGFTDSIVFPDLGGLALEIKREFNFEV